MTEKEETLQKLKHAELILLSTSNYLKDDDPRLDRVFKALTELMEDVENE